jgi:hypothetical protein
LNNVRIGNGASAVTYDSRLDAAAQGHADDMVDRGYFAHNSPEGDDVRDRILEQGYIPIAYGENLARGQQSQAGAITGWENSPAHDAMMNATTLEEFGLGMAGSPLCTSFGGTESFVAAGRRLLSGGLGWCAVYTGGGHRRFHLGTAQYLDRQQRHPYVGFYPRDIQLGEEQLYLARAIG